TLGPHGAGSTAAAPPSTLLPPLAPVEFRSLWGVLRVSAIEMKTPEELFVENGTEARFPCTFSSSDEISSAMSVSWSFQPEGAMTPISVRVLCLG
uniref:Uncharacterized protein n=1 Tax=Chrysemys picta bellii TaxID=8478 RepID=A0A8C3FLQ6_CHRPI